LRFRFLCRLSKCKICRQKLCREFNKWLKEIYHTVMIEIAAHTKIDACDRFSFPTKGRNYIKTVI